ncbi:MAG: GGDEF domain-containing protein [Pseudomonadota bacterium]|nr:GGDEF domain-containing protein [Pseudomonadota bacterium]
MTSLTVVNTVLQSLVLGLYAWSGEIQWAVAIAFAGISVGSTALFTLMVGLHWNLRLPENWLLYAQLAANTLISLVFLGIAPQLATVFMVSLLVTFNFAMVSFSPRQFLWGWLGFGAATAVALWAGRARFSSLAATDFNMFVLWLFFFLAIRRLALIGTQFSRLRSQLSEKNLQLTQSLERINELATHDELTGAFNRRKFMELLTDEQQRATRTGEIFSVAIFDVDHFKAVNDKFGHHAGDLVLKEFCEGVRATMRTTDRFARYGGDEFVLLMPATTSAESAAAAVDRIRLVIAAKGWGSVVPGHTVTLSAGVAAFCKEESNQQLLGRADAALYAAKRNGRNCCVAAAAAS